MRGAIAPGVAHAREASAGDPSSAKRRTFYSIQGETRHIGAVKKEMK